MTAADRWLKLLPQAEEAARVRAHLLAAEALLGKGDNAAARRVGATSACRVTRSEPLAPRP